MAQALQAIKFARTYLNDINGTTWTYPNTYRYFRQFTIWFNSSHYSNFINASR